MFQNPKKELNLNFNIDYVRTSILKIEKKDCPLVKNDLILNEVVFHNKGVLLDLGYHITFSLTPKSDTETHLLIEVSRNIGSINTAAENSISNNILKRVSSELSAYLSNEIDPKTGQLVGLPNKGCMMTSLIIVGFMSLGIVGGVYGLLKIIF
jgi:hypothetical protein